MKKLLGMMSALALLAPTGANAELLKNLKLGGQWDIQTTSAQNVTDFVTRANTLAGGSGPGAVAYNGNDRIGHASTRIMVKLDWDMLDDVHARVTLVKGAFNVAASTHARTYGQISQNTHDFQSAVFIEEANVKIDKIMGFLDLTAGRQFYGEEGDLIIYYGPRNNYGLTISAVDMFRADWNGENMSVTGIAGKTSDTGITTLGSTSIGNTDLRGLTASFKMYETFKPGVYVYNSLTHAAPGNRSRRLGSHATRLKRAA